MHTYLFICLQLALKEINFVFIWDDKNMFIDMLGYVTFHLNVYLKWFVKVDAIKF